MKSDTKYQSIESFIQRPFGKAPLVSRKSNFEQKYIRLRQKIKVTGYTEIDESVFIHVSIPSESKENYFYDVVLQFFPPNDVIKKEKTYMNYYMKFFSNSPSFIYNYAALYNINGYLIYILLEKLDMAYAKKLPSIRNHNLEICYDVSIYMACRYLIEHKVRYMTKLGSLLTVKKLGRRFFQDMRDFKQTEFDLKTFSVQKQLNKMKAEQEESYKDLAKKPEKVEYRNELSDDKNKGRAVTYAKKVKPQTPSKSVSYAKRVKRYGSK